jgi:guanine deaminase
MGDIHEQHLRRAIQLAEENVRMGRGGPFGALVARGVEILAEGTNLVTSCNDPTAHAEVVAIREACRKLGTFQLTGCVVYASCEPCPMCLGAIYWARPDALYFAASRDDAAGAGFDDSLIYEEIPRLLEARRLPTQTLLRAEGQSPFRLWHSSASRVNY